MSESIIFDTHRFVKRMTDAGLATPVAEALADEYTQLLERNLSTKTDIAQLEQTTRQDIAQLQQTTQESIAKLQQEIARLEQTTRQDITRLEAKIAETKVELIKWNVGTMLVFGSLLVAALKFL